MLRRVARTLLFVIIVAALAVVVSSLLRRTPRTARARNDEPPARRERGAEARSAAPQADEVAVLDRHAVARRLHELAFGAPLDSVVTTARQKFLAAAAKALDDAAADSRYAPRRPLLLPKLVRAVSDNDTSRRELAGMIARDPALVGSLLKLANSSFYRRNAQPIESVERAIVVLGTQGVRALIAAALVQPVFRSGSADHGTFPDVVWEHSYRSAAAAEVHAAAVEGTDLFAAQLLALVMGLAAIVVFRVALDVYAAQGQKPDPSALGALLDAHTAAVAERIAASWELSDRVLEALAEQRPDASVEPASPLGRSLRFGLLAGALSVLQSNGVIEPDVGLKSLAAAGGSGPRFERMWERFTASAAA